VSQCLGHLLDVSGCEIDEQRRAATQILQAEPPNLVSGSNGIHPRAAYEAVDQSIGPPLQREATLVCKPLTLWVPSNPVRSEKQIAPSVVLLFPKIAPEGLGEFNDLLHDLECAGTEEDLLFCLLRAFSSLESDEVATGIRFDQATVFSVTIEKLKRVEKGRRYFAVVRDEQRGVGQESTVYW